MSIGNVPFDPNTGASLRAWFESLRQHVSRPKRPLFLHAKDFNSGPSFTEINSLGIYGVRFMAVGDSIHHMFYVPKDFNVGTNIKFEALWCTDSVDTSETATWEILYSSSAEGEALTAATTALDSAITADNVLGAYKLAISPYGLLYKDAMEHGDILHIKLSLSAVSGLNPAVDAVFLIGLIINDEG